MKIPGFTAELSLYAPCNTYLMVRSLEQSNGVIISGFGNCDSIENRKAPWCNPGVSSYCATRCQSEFPNFGFCLNDCFDKMYYRNNLPDIYS